MNAPSPALGAATVILASRSQPAAVYLCIFRNTPVTLVPPDPDPKDQVYLVSRGPAPEKPSLTLTGSA